MTGLHTSALTSSPFPPATVRASSATEGGEKAAPDEVLRDPYEWKSACGLASALFVASLAPMPAMDHKKFAAEINTKTLRAAAAVTVSPRRLLRVRH